MTMEMEEAHSKGKILRRSEEVGKGDAADDRGAGARDRA
jgi:hypothetical protein